MTADDELLLMAALEFEPIARPPGYIRAVPVLCDYALPSIATRLSIIGFALCLAMFREPQRTLKVEGVAKHLLAVPERNSPGVVAAQIEQIEKIQPYRDPAEQIG